MRAVATAPGFATVIGNQATVALLQRLVAGRRVPPAVILDGPPGCGRQTMALALAAAQLCHQPQAGDACGHCASCELMAAAIHPDCLALPHDSEMAELAVDLVRDEVVARAAETALHGHGRIFLIPAAERLRREAANALLKVLEEPPAGTTLILTAGSGEGLLPTIRSRAQRFRMQPLSVDECERVLIRQGMAAPEAAQRARSAAGSHRRARQSLGSAVPLSELRALIGAGYEAGRIAGLVADCETAAASVPGKTPAARVRNALRGWLDSLLEDLRRDLAGSDPAAVDRRIARVLQARRDLAVNLDHRLVLEGLSLP